MTKFAEIPGSYLSVSGYHGGAKAQCKNPNYSMLLEWMHWFGR